MPGKKKNPDASLNRERPLRLSGLWIILSITMFNDCIIMAGGSGTRLWPASSSRMPKQFLPVPKPGGAGTFFNAAVERALAATGSDGQVLIIAGRAHAAAIVKACEQYPPEDLKRLLLIPEPEAKNTAPAIACAVNFIDWMSGEERKVLVLTSDHIIDPLDSFLLDARAAASFAQADKLAVFGINPRGPETGYGYIETETLVSSGEEKPRVRTVKTFREKPDKQTAETFLKAGNFFWNSGMFAFSSKFILGEFRRLAPEVITPFGRLRAPDERSFRTERGLRILWDWLDLKEAYKNAEAVSFDYAIAEKCSQTVMVEADFTWTDVGSWDEYAALLEGASMNRTELFACNAENCFADSKIPVALIGVEDLIVVVRPEGILVSKKGRSQDVREIVRQMTDRGRTELL